MSPRARPTDLALAICCSQDRTGDGWVYADEVRGKLLALGFPGLTAQQVSQFLRRLVRDELPLVERREDYSGVLQFRLTAHATTLVWNRLRLRLYAPWLPVMR